MDTQKKSIELEFKFNPAAANDYGSAFGALASYAVGLASAIVLSYFINGTIACILGVVIGYVLFKVLKKHFEKLRSEAIMENVRAVDEAIAPYGLYTYYSGSIGYFDRMSFFDKETDEEFRSPAGSVNGNVVRMVISNDLLS